MRNGLYVPRRTGASPPHSMSALTHIFRQGSPVFYDNWVARDINGTALENAPFESVFHQPFAQDRFQRHLPVQMQSCWNGIAIMDPAPFYTPPHVKFRMARITEGECSASECSLISNDYWDAGYGRILMVPRVKLAYDGVGRQVRALWVRADKGPFWLVASVRHSTPPTEEPYFNTRLCSPRWSSRQPTNRSARSCMVRPARPTVHRRGKRTH